MKFFAPFIAACAIALASCSGNFATGTGMPNTIPQPGESQPPPYGTSGIPQPGTTVNPQSSASPSAMAEGSYAITDAQSGFACPSTVDGYSCLLKFNVPMPTPEPSASPKGKNKATPSPSPTPTPTPTPSPEPSGSGSPSPSPTPATVTLKAEALPKNAPGMYHTPANTLDVVPLMMVQVSPSADLPLTNAVVAQFTLPKEQVGQRGFAVQLFQAQTHKKKTDYKPIWTFNQSTLKNDTLTFAFMPPPKMSIAKASTYVLVLYGDDKSQQSPAPSESPSPAATVPASPAPTLSPAGN